ncbi:MAG: ribonuclease PH, partial [Planctomycetes bacterium]|nr:ribonuclease PH [Planctomycetota bacterium]
QSILKNPIKSQVAAVSVGKVKGQILLDLDYPEDSRAEVDFNVALTGEGEFVEIQGTAESKPFTEQELAELIKLARKGISEIIEIQKKNSRA